MAEFPSVEERLLNSGIPREMAAEIAAEVSSTKQASGLASGLQLIVLLLSIGLAIILIPLVYLAAVHLWGGIRACGSGMLTSAHAIAWLQWFAAMQWASLIQGIWLRTASHRTRMHVVAAELLRAYFWGVGTGTMRPVIKKHPECGTAEGYFRYLIWFRMRFGILICVVLQSAVVAALFLIPLAC